MRVVDIFGPLFEWRYSLLDVGFMIWIAYANLPFWSVVVIALSYFFIDATLFQTIRDAHEQKPSKSA